MVVFEPGTLRLAVKCFNHSQSIILWNSHCLNVYNEVSIPVRSGLTVENNRKGLRMCNPSFLCFFKRSDMPDHMMIGHH